jgi:hypothetical protein
MTAIRRLCKAAAAALGIAAAAAGLAITGVGQANHLEPGQVCPDFSCNYRTL